MTFYRPKSDVENIDEDKDNDIDDIDDFDEDDLSYEGKEFFIRQCLLLRMKGTESEAKHKNIFIGRQNGGSIVQLKGMGIRLGNRATLGPLCKFIEDWNCRSELLPVIPL